MLPVCLRPSIFRVLFASLATLLLAGCSASFAPSAVTPNEVPIGNIQGVVHGGQAPVTGAQIYLFAAGAGPAGTLPTSLITSGDAGVTCNASSGMSNAALNSACYVTTDAGGNFSLSGDYKCKEGEQVYMVALGGNPGLSGSVNNTGIVQMAALGECPASKSMASQVPYLVINEVTTVAFAYSMSGFGTNAFTVSSTAAGKTALANAFANANNIVTLGDGQAPSVVNGNANSINPQAKIYELANILATCVNTSSSSSSQCSSLFSTATTSSGTAATDESNAIFNIAQNQAQNVSALWNLRPSTPVFGSFLSGAPTDWTLPVIYENVISALSTNSGGNTIVGGPYNLVFDASGNAWIGDRINGVIEISPQGAVTTFSNSANGFSMVKGVAISPQDGSLWISDYGNNQVDVMQASGNTLTLEKTITTNLASNGPILTAFALNPSGSGDYMAYEATESTTGIAAYDAATYAALDFADTDDSNSDYTNVKLPGWISVDDKGSVWIPSDNTNYLGDLTVTYSGGAVQYPANELGAIQSYTTAADGLSDVWLATNTTTAPTIYYATAGTLKGSYTGGGMNEPYKLVVDGSNTVWIANYGANTVSALNVSGGAKNGTWLSSNGFSTGTASGTSVVVIGVDPSGDVWTGNGDLSVTQLLGLGTPTAAPFYGGSSSVSTATGVPVTTVTKGNLGRQP
jgi:hypothetical protein